MSIISRFNRRQLSLAISLGLSHGFAMAFNPSLDLNKINEENGIVFEGIGDKVSPAGDINGDGIDDVIIVSREINYFGFHAEGAAYVVFGSNEGFNGEFNVSEINGSNGFSLGESSKNAIGIGDVNGDGIDDLLVGEKSESIGSRGFLVFGSTDGFSSTLELSSLNNERGIPVNLNIEDEILGVSLSYAGDVNGDGVHDFIIGSITVNNDQFDIRNYVIFGSEQGYSSSIELSNLNGENGFSFEVMPVTQSFTLGINIIFGDTGIFDEGWSVKYAGDVNADGFSDLVIGVPNDATNGLRSGAAFVVFGSGQPFHNPLKLSDINGVNGFAVYGVKEFDQAGISVGSAGDINGDQVDDIIIGAVNATWFGDQSGASYVIFGSDQDFSSSIELSSLQAPNGFTINGRKGGSINRVGSAGDLNGDGLSDIVIAGGSSMFASVLFGSEQNFPRFVNTDDLDGVNGFDIVNSLGSEMSFRNTITSIKGIGDFNNDGIGDLMIGNFNKRLSITFQEPEFQNKSYIILGSNAPPPSVIIDNSQVITTGHRGTYFDPDISGQGIMIDIDKDAKQVFLSWFTYDRQAGASKSLGSADQRWYTAQGEIAGNLVNLELRESTHGVFNNALQPSSQVIGSLVLMFTGCNSAIIDYTIEQNDGLPDMIGSLDLTRLISTSDDCKDHSRNVDLSTIDGSNGFSIEGIEIEGVVTDRGVVIPSIEEFDGSQMSFAGDVNGDGIDDIIIGSNAADTNGERSGAGHVIFGSSGAFPSRLNVSELDGSNGFLIENSLSGIGLGNSVSFAGDLNGDQLDDIVIDGISKDSDRRKRMTYVIYGKNEVFSKSFDVASLNGINGFKIQGTENSLYVGGLNGGGDFNGDGIDDLVIGEEWIFTDSGFNGISYVVFGSTQSSFETIELTNLDGRNGFSLVGENSFLAGTSVSIGGDFNNDGIDDVIIGAPFLNLPFQITYGAEAVESSPGVSYIFYGSTQEFSSSIDLSDLNGNTGIVVDGLNDEYINNQDYTPIGIIDTLGGLLIDDGKGTSVSYLGDINGDLIDDVIVSAPYAIRELVSVFVPGTGGSMYFESSISSESYVLFGGQQTSEANLDISTLNGSNGFTILGDDTSVVSRAGDVNGDSINDILIHDNRKLTIVYGSRKAFPKNLDLNKLTRDQGFSINGEVDVVGYAGDMNNDGIDDIIVAQKDFNNLSSGVAYVVFGKTDPTPNLVQQGSVVSGYRGTYYDPATTGQGIMVDINADASQLFLSWFTFAPIDESVGKSAVTDQRWLTAQGSIDGPVTTLELYSSSGGVFNEAVAPSSQLVGTVTIEFPNCRSVKLGYFIDQGIGEFPLAGVLNLQRLIDTYDCIDQ